MPKSLEARLADADPLVGTVLTLPGATAAELLAEPFDLVWVDLEHAALGPRDAQEIVLGAQAAGAFALARLPADAYPLMTQLLDAGADGVVLANVASAASATRAIEHTSHPPNGTRGWGPRRLSLRGRSTGGPTLNPSIWVQLESAAGIDNVEQILAVPGVSAAVVGTADLSFALGRPLDNSAPELVAAVQKVRHACSTARVAFGVAGALTAAPHELYNGASILLHSTDARLCATAVDHAAEWMRAALEHKPDGATS